MNAARRKFLCLTAGGAASLSAAVVGGWVGAARQKIEHSGNLQSVTQSGWALGSDVAITALHASRSVAQEAICDAFAQLELVESVMSIYRPESQLSRLNRDGVLHQPHAILREVLQASRAMSLASSGAFDITVQPLWSLFAAAQKSQTLPSDEEVERARRCVDWRRVMIADNCVRLRGDSTAITLNGIAQGYAADRAAAALARHGIRHALISAGEIGALGTNADGDPWRVGIQHPRLDDAYISLAKLAGRSLATSGDYATSFTADFRANHLFDPRTGRSPNELASVSIAASTALQADALSTAVFVLGPAAGMKLVQHTPSADAFFVLKSGRTLATANFPLEASHFSQQVRAQ